ncbi:CD48 antigen-like [Chanodichthys erythropterus]|uniref:CD48 antigen-like n=1 Tax=Chanodichthys erythropterus TaxID=933992 RepID=UPI00351F14C2
MIDTDIKILRMILNNDLANRSGPPKCHHSCHMWARSSFRMCQMWAGSGPTQCCYLGYLFISDVTFDEYGEAADLEPGRPGVFRAETNETQSVSVMEGDSVTLNSDLTEIPDDSIIWQFGANNSQIAKIKRKKQIFSTYSGTAERFRDRLKLDDQTGSLTITNISTEHAGVYKVQMLGAKQSSKTFNVSVYARLPVPVISSNSSQCSSSSSSSNCSLVCSAVNVSHVTLSWYKGNSLLSSISVSDLSISLSLPLEVEYQDKNTYSCVLNNPISNQTQHLDITQLCHTCAVSQVVLISVAATGSLLIVAAVGIFCIYKKQRKKDQEGKCYLI